MRVEEGMSMEAPQRSAGRAAALDGIAKLMRPSSVVIIGMSSKPGSPSATVLENLLGDGYAGKVHLVGRVGGVIGGLPCATSMDDVPYGIDLAIMVVAASAVRETLEACIARGIRSAVCFASGFAEAGEEGRREQEEIGRIARENGLPLLGPNCVGYYNYVDGFQAMLAPSSKIAKVGTDVGRTLVVVSQSGGAAHHVTQTLTGRGVPVSYMVTTGNEADLGIADFISYLLDQPTTGAVVCYVEQIRCPTEMLAVTERARQRGIPILMLHPGKSDRAREVSASHSGALVGDYAAMRTIVEASGVLMIDTLEELIDAAEILLRFPEPSGSGVGIVTASGAIAVITADYCETIGLEVPPISPSRAAQVRPYLPDYLKVRNPLDLGANVAWQPDGMRVATDVMLKEPAIGGVLISNPYVGGLIGQAWAQGATSHDGGKPIIYVVHDEDVPLPPEVSAILANSDLLVKRSPERALRALAHVIEYGRRRRSWKTVSEHPRLRELPALGHGKQPEWLGKKFLAEMGIRIPVGALARSIEEAIAIAERIGFPVAMKAQSAALAHKSDVGGVLLDISDEAALRSGWSTLHENVARAVPAPALDGVLIERMGPSGVELAVGARRDPRWGPVVMAGLGGIWIEALADVRLLSPTSPQEGILQELRKLRNAGLLKGIRGLPAVDLAAVAQVASLVGRVMVARPEIAEIDINPLIANMGDAGALALDALLVVK